MVSFNVFYSSETPGEKLVTDNILLRWRKCTLKAPFLTPSIAVCGTLFSYLIVDNRWHVIILLIYEILSILWIFIGYSFPVMTSYIYGINVLFVFFV